MTLMIIIIGVIALALLILWPSPKEPSPATNWKYCARRNGCRCNLLRVCIRAHCTCNLRKACHIHGCSCRRGWDCCTDPNCACGRPKVVTDYHSLYLMKNKYCTSTGCECGLPWVCVRRGCECTDIKICTNCSGNCKCGREHVCKSPDACHCGLAGIHWFDKIDEPVSSDRGSDWVSHERRSIKSKITDPKDTSRPLRDYD